MEASPDQPQARVERLRETQRRARQIHEEAIVLQEHHAEHARAQGDLGAARLGDERAARARMRLSLLPPDDGAAPSSES